MLKARLILILTSILIILGIFQLPKFVVKNDETTLAKEPSTGADRGDSAHGVVSEAQGFNIRRLLVAYKTTSQKEKSAIFADSLASAYAEINKFDSAAHFAEEAAVQFKSLESLIKAGDQYYKAYTFAVQEEKQKYLAGKTREFYGRVLELSPKNDNVKTRLAMTYVNTENPMKGVQMLREVLAADPQNEEALFNLGMLSIQSGQYERAVERLEVLTKLNPGHIQANLLLGIAWMNMGNKDKARKQFEKVKEMDNSSSVQATVDSYLKDLK